MEPLQIFFALFLATTLLIHLTRAAPSANPGCCCGTCFGCSCCCCGGCRGRQQFGDALEGLESETDEAQVRSPFLPALVAGAVEAAELIGPALAMAGRFALNAIKNVPPQMWDNIGTATGIAADAATVVFDKQEEEQ